MCSRFTGSDYIHEDAVDWDTAVQNCKRAGGYLAPMEGVQEVHIRWVLLSCSGYNGPRMLNNLSTYTYSLYIYICFNPCELYPYINIKRQCTHTEKKARWIWRVFWIQYSNCIARLFQFRYFYKHTTTTIISIVIVFHLSFNFSFSCRFPNTYMFIPYGRHTRFLGI